MGKKCSDRENWIPRYCPRGNGGKSITYYMCLGMGPSPEYCVVDSDSLSFPGERSREVFWSYLISAIIF